MIKPNHDFIEIKNLHIVLHKITDKLELMNNEQSTLRMALDIFFDKIEPLLKRINVTDQFDDNQFSFDFQIGISLRTLPTFRFEKGLKNKLRPSM